MKLGEIAIESRKTYKGDKTNFPIVGLEHLISGEIRFNEYDVNTENTFTRFFSKGQVLFGRRRAYLKKAAVAEFDGICSGDITVIEAIPSKIVPELLPFILQNDNLFDFAVSRSAGGLSPRVKWEDLSEFEVCLPSMEEQKILADKLWAAYRLKESYKKLLAATDDMVKSQFIEMLAIDPQYKTLDNACSYIGKGITPKYVETSTIAVVNQACVYWDGLHLDNVKYHDSGIALKKSLLENGDVLLNSTGSGTLGRSCLYINPGGDKDYITDGHVAVLKTEPKFILPEVLVMYFSLKDTQEELYRNYVTGSTNQVDIVFTSIKNMKIPTPQIDLQKKFISIKHQADKSKFGGFKSQFIEMFGNNVPMKKISDVCDVRGGSTPTRTTDEYWKNGTVSWFTIDDIYQQGRYIYETKQHITQLATKKCFVYPIDTVLICCTASIGEYAIVNKEMASNQQFNGLMIKDKQELHPEFLLYVASTLKEDLLRQSGKTTINFVSRSKLESMEIPIPDFAIQEEFITIAQQADKSKVHYQKIVA